MPVSGRREAEVSGRRPAGRHSHGSGLGRGYRVQGWPCARPPFAELAFAFKSIFGNKSAGDRRVHRETARSELRRLEFISNCLPVVDTASHAYSLRRPTSIG